MKELNIFKLISILVTSLLLFLSCSKEIEQNLPSEKVNYYVKYEVKNAKAYTKIRFLTEKGIEETNITGITWEGTYVPVDKRFIAFLDIPESPSNEIHARIYISKEKGPFVIKAEGQSKNSFSLHAKIDF